MKRTNVGALLLAAAVMLTACSGSSTANETNTTETETLPVENGIDAAGADANLSIDNAASLDANLAAPADVGALNEGNAAE